MATFFFYPGPDIHSYFNLSTMVTFPLMNSEYKTPSYIVKGQQKLHPYSASLVSVSLLMI